MSELDAMRAVAEWLLEAWAPACERIEIAGSIRRGKSDPHDIEIVAVPKLEVLIAERDMFADSDVTMAERNLFDEMLAEWKDEGLRLAHRLDKNGRPAWGPRFKRALYGDDAVDIFSVLPPAQLGVIFAIRTGPAEFSHALVTSRLEGGFMPVGMQVKDGALWVSGGTGTGHAKVETPEEEDFFRELGLPCWPPAERSLMRLAEWRRQQHRATT